MELQAVTLPLSDDKIIALYWARDEKAITETDRKYKNYLYSVARNIVYNAPDCEDKQLQSTLFWADPSSLWLAVRMIPPLRRHRQRAVKQTAYVKATPWISFLRPRVFLLIFTILQRKISEKLVRNN